MSLIIKYFGILEDSYLDVMVLDCSLLVMEWESAVVQMCSHNGMSCEKISSMAAVMDCSVEVVYLGGFRVIKNGRILEVWGSPEWLGEMSLSTAFWGEGAEHQGAGIQYSTSITSWVDHPWQTALPLWVSVSSSVKWGIIVNHLPVPGTWWVLSVCCIN